MEYSGIVSDKTWDFINLVENEKVQQLALNLQHVKDYFKEFVLEYHELKFKSEKYKALSQSLKEKQEKSCCNCIDLKAVIASKNTVIELVASSLTRLNETKNLDIVKDIFKILCGDVTTLTPPKDNPELGVSDIKKEAFSNGFSTPKTDKFSPSFTEGACNDESASEIEGTPTGRTSPIIFSKRAKSRTIADKTETGIKKKGSDKWPTSEMKLVKLSYRSPTTTATKTKVKLKQGRLNLSRHKTSQVVDLTCSPLLRKAESDDVQKFIAKKESLDNDDTILPSPTSNPIQSNFMSLYKSNSAKHSPCKFKPPAVIQIKTEDETNLIVETLPNCPPLDSDATHMEESINLLQPIRFPRTPTKHQVMLKETDSEMPTQFDANINLSILQQVDKIERDAQSKVIAMSPTKVPLAENMNITNIQTQDDIESSMSLLRRDTFKRPDRNSPVKSKKTSPKKMEPLFKEPTVRKKAEKRALPGWSCDECKNYYSVRYKDDTEMLAKLMEECSKHRGRHDPARPATPPGYWETRWEVPDDTEAFNRRNNAI